MDHLAERRQSTDGRRNGDAWLGRALKIATLIAICAAPALAFNSRLARLEESQPAMLYMTCWLMSDAHPRQVPAVCAQAIRGSQ